MQPKEDEDYIYLYRTLTGTIQEYPAVLAVSPRLRGDGAARNQDQVESVNFIGMDPDAEKSILLVQRR